MSKLKFFTEEGTITECLGYPTDFTMGMGYHLVDMAIDYEKECILNKEGFHKVKLIKKFWEWVATNPDFGIPIDMDDTNLHFLVAFIVSDVAYKYEMTNAWMNASPEERQVITKHYGKLFGYYAHKKQQMLMDLGDRLNDDPEEN